MRRETALRPVGVAARDPVGQGSVCRLTSAFPDSERFGLTAQMRRSAVSVPSNIAEGAARNGKSEFVHFLGIARGSLSELDTQLVIAREMGYCPHDELIGKLINDEFRLRLLAGLINSLKTSKPQ